MFVVVVVVFLLFLFFSIQPSKIHNDLTGTVLPLMLRYKLCRLSMFLFFSILMSWVRCGISLSIVVSDFLCISVS